MAPKISVIIPGYNTEEYVRDAIESVLSQDFTDFELILVDDGSTDSTGEIMDRMAENDARIRVIHQANGGLSMARNAGLDMAAGEWIYFLDSDDLIAPRALGTLLDSVEESGAEIALAPYKRFRGRANEDRPKRAHARKGEVMSGTEATELALYQRRIDNAACGKLYARRLWEKLRFRKGILYEDLDIFYRLWPPAEKVVVLDEPLYLYRQQPNSILHRFNRRRLDVLDVTDRMVHWIEKEHPELTAAARDRRMSAHYNMLLLMSRHGYKDADAQERCARVIREQAPASLRNGSVRAKNRIGALVFLTGGARLATALSNFM